MKTKYITILCAAFAILYSCNQPTPHPTTTNGEATDFNVDNTHASSNGSRVIYELNLYNFTQEGTFAAAQAQLPRLAQLGIDIIWLMPIQPRGNGSAAMGISKIGTLGSPYSVRDYTAVNPDHGTLADMKQFVEAAHQAGIEVWLDWVPNHTAPDNVWVSTHLDYYVLEGGKPKTVRYTDNSQRYNDVCQLNFNNPQMVNAMIDAMCYWVTNTNIDGYRIDFVSSPVISNDFWDACIGKLRQIKPDISLMGEADFDTDDNNHLFNAGQAAGGFDYDYAWAFNTNVQQFGTARNVAALLTACQQLVGNDNYTDMDRMVYLTNHDDGALNNGNQTVDHYILKLGDNLPPLTVLEFTFYGMPLLFNGQEIAYPILADNFNRTPIDWNNGNKKVENTIRTLIALRHQYACFHGGNADERPTTTFLQTSAAEQNSTIAFTKEKDGQKALVVLNFSRAQKVTIFKCPEGEATLVLDSKTIENGPTTAPAVLQGEFNGSVSIDMEGKGYAIYILK
mgnify:CR=1 FL=1